MDTGKPLPVQVAPESVEVKIGVALPPPLASAANLFPSAEEVTEIQDPFSSPVWTQIAPASAEV